MDVIQFQSLDVAIFVVLQPNENIESKLLSTASWFHLTSEQKLVKTQVVHYFGVDWNIFANMYKENFLESWNPLIFEL